MGGLNRPTHGNHPNIGCRWVVTMVGIQPTHDVPARTVVLTCIPDGSNIQVNIVGDMNKQIRSNPVHRFRVSKSK